MACTSRRSPRRGSLLINRLSFSPQGIGQGIGKGSEQHPGVGISAGQERRPGAEQRSFFPYLPNRKPVPGRCNPFQPVAAAPDGERRSISPRGIPGPVPVLRRCASSGNGAAHRDGQTDQHRTANCRMDCGVAPVARFNRASAASPGRWSASSSKESSSAARTSSSHSAGTP